jgi:hypothetical protein
MATGNRGKTENLIPYKPGQSGNPSGRPKRAPVTDYLRDQLEMEVPKELLDRVSPQELLMMKLVMGEKPTFGQFVAFKSIQATLKGDIFALKEVLDRVEGKVTQKVDHGGRITLETLLTSGHEGESSE